MGARFVIDNSVVMTWCFADEADPYADAVLEHLKTHTAVVPPIWSLEVVNVLLVAERRTRLTQKDSAHFLSLLAKLPIQVDPTPGEDKMRELLNLGRTQNLTSYDAACLELAMRLGIPLATLDQRLIAAAGKTGVPIFAVSADLI
jgi:predicted nucleic acid-binding protein